MFLGQRDCLSSARQIATHYFPINGPVNRFHVRELTRNEFLKALRVEFRSCTVFGQRPLSGSIIVAEYKDNGDSFDLFKTFEKRDENHFKSSEGLARPLYFVIVASNGAIGSVFSSAYIETADVDAPIRLRMLTEDLREEAASLLLKSEHLEAESQDTAKLKSELDRLKAALAFADTEMERVREQGAAAIGRAESRAAARARERDAARAGELFAVAEAARERDGALAARALVETEATERARQAHAAEVSQLSEDRDFLARQLSRAYRRPLRPLRHFVVYHLLTALGFLSAPFSARRVARFRRSAEKRNPLRFDEFLSVALEPRPDESLWIRTHYGVPMQSKLVALKQYIGPEADDTDSNAKG